MVAVAITQHLVIEQAMTEAWHHLELEALIRGKLVAVKPNDTWASAEDTTHGEKMAFPAPSLQDAIGVFTTAAYGKPLTC
jgi:hypothetical protein